MRKIFALFVIVLCLVNINAAFCAQREPITNHAWVWNVLVIPPSTGWDNEPGKSIKSALTWCEREISESSISVANPTSKQ